jgi:hypothetical protein
MTQALDRSNCGVGEASWEVTCSFQNCSAAMNRFRSFRSFERVTGTVHGKRTPPNFGRVFGP